MKCFVWTTSLLIALAISPAAAQEHGEGHGGESHTPHKATVTFGYTHVRHGVKSEHSEETAPDTGVWVPTLGAAYTYSLNHRWAIAGVFEWEFADYVVLKEDLQRDSAFILVALVAYEIMPAWEVFAGAGVEFEKNENVQVFRVATEYAFEVHERGWSVGPAIIYDIKKKYDAWSFALAAGKRF